MIEILKNWANFKEEIKGSYFLATLKNGIALRFTKVIDIIDYLGEKWIILEFKDERKFFVKYNDISFVEIIKEVG